jgi:hypothetical protein
MPDSLNDRIVPVSGTIDAHDGHVHLNIGNVLSFEGTMHADASISGTAEYQGQLVEFVAERGELKGSR